MERKKIAKHKIEKKKTETAAKTQSNVINLSSRFLQHQFDYWQASLKLMQNFSNRWLDESSIEKKSENTDKRFHHELWSQNPVFDFVKEYYFLNSNFVKNFINEFTLQFDDPKVQQQMNFATQQWLDALSPSNFLLTNPEVFELAMETKGESLWKGLQQFLQDLERDTGILNTKLTDLNAFKVGENLAVTPGKVVFQNELIQLIVYEPQTEKVFKKPILFIPPWINKFYILDLQPHNSMVNYMVQQGFTVFMISWVNPDKRQANKTFSDYLIEGAYAASEFIYKKIGNIPFHIVGYCIGGTLLSIFLSYLTAKKKNWIASATFFASLMDFSNPGDLGIFIDEVQLQFLKQHMEKRGYLEGSVMASTFNSLRANDLIWSCFVNNYLKGHQPRAFDLLFWNSDNTNMPGKLHYEYLHDMYFKNLLIQPKALKYNNVPIDLTQIKIPSYFIATSEDHIAPWTACYKSMQNFSGLKKFVLAGSGHVAGIINPPEKNKYGYWLNSTLEENPEVWLKKATSYPGSWWLDWTQWLKKINSETVLASERLKSFPEFLEKAPGTYVKKKCAKHMPAEFQNYFFEKLKWWLSKPFEKLIVEEQVEQKKKLQKNK